MDPIQDQAVWDIFSMSPEDIATVYKQDLEIKTEPALLSSGRTQSMNGTIRLLTRDLDAWLLPSEARLRVRFRITNGVAPLYTPGVGGPPAVVESYVGLGDWAPITLINGGFNLFDNLEIKLNGKTVDRVDKPGKVQLMHGYASYSAEYVKQCQDLEWFYPESATPSVGTVNGTWNQQAGQRQLTGFACAIDNDTQTGVYANANTSSQLMAAKAKRNESFQRRFARTRGERVVELWLPLSAVSGFCKDNTKVIRGMTMEVSLNRNTEWASILHGQLNALNSSLAELIPGGGPPVVTYPGAAYALIDEVSLFVPQLKPSLAMASHIEQQLMNDAATKWIFTEMTTYQSDQYQQNTTQLRWQITSTAHRPLLALVGFQSVTQYSRQLDRDIIVGADAAANTVLNPVQISPLPTTRQQHGCANGGLFSSLGDITSVEFRVNGLIVPNESYQISFLNETYKRAYYDFRRVFHKDDPTEQGIFDEATYRDSPIFCFDLRAIGMESIYQNIKTNNIEFRATMLSNAVGAGPGVYGSDAFQCFCVLVSEKEASVEAKGGRLSIMP